ncbi:hypothetical protein MAR_035185, partial [Mya arenaria]
ISRTLFFSTLTQIRRYRPNKKQYSGSVVDGQHVTSMDVDIEKHLLYWTDEIQRSIFRTPMPERPEQKGIPQNIESNRDAQGQEKGVVIFACLFRMDSSVHALTELLFFREAYMPVMRLEKMSNQSPRSARVGMVEIASEGIMTNSRFSGHLCELKELQELQEPESLTSATSNNHLLVIFIPMGCVMFAVLVIGIAVLVKCRRRLTGKHGEAKLGNSGGDGAQKMSALQVSSSTVQSTGSDGHASTNFSNPVFETFQGEEPGTCMKEVGKEDNSLGNDLTMETELGRSEMVARFP